MKFLPWSEHYHGRLEGGCITLEMLGEVEDIDVELLKSIGERSQRQLFESGETLDL